MKVDRSTAPATQTSSQAGETTGAPTASANLAGLGYAEQARRVSPGGGAAPPTAPTPKPRPKPEINRLDLRQVRVLPGDTLYDIAEAELGDGARWKEIAEANGITDPKALKPWQVLVIPGTSVGFRGPVRRPDDVPGRPDDAETIGRPVPRPSPPADRGRAFKIPPPKPRPKPTSEAPVVAPAPRKPTDVPGTPEVAPTIAPAPRKPSPPARAPLSATHGPVAPPQDQGAQSAAWQMGYKVAMRRVDDALDRIEGDPRTLAALSRASDLTHITVDNLVAMAVIESGGNRGIGTNVFGYTGLMQMGKDAAKDVGMSYQSLKGADNVENNALAGAKYWNTNDKRLDDAIPRTPLHMYLAHQQGAGGTNKLWRTIHGAPDTPANRNQLNNLPESVRKALGPTITQQEFYDYWAGNMAAIEQRIAERKR